MFATSAPSISTDQADYSPGATVVLSGSGWQPSEAVHIVVAAADGQIWSYSTDVTADGSGAIQASFALPNYFVASYFVTATGSSGSVATASFTDSNLTSTVCDVPFGNTLSVDNNQNINYIVTITNLGDATSNIAANDPLMGGQTFLGCIPAPGCTYSSTLNTVFFNTGPIGAGASISYYIRVELGIGPETVFNTATITNGPSSSTTTVIVGGPGTPSLTPVIPVVVVVNTAVPTNTAIPTNTAVPPTNTPVPPTNTPVPPTSTAAVASQNGSTRVKPSGITWQSVASTGPHTATWCLGSPANHRPVVAPAH
jgi:Domain of unknown function DUF11